jgi:hypothetical protein
MVREGRRLRVNAAEPYGGRSVTVSQKEDIMEGRIFIGIVSLLFVACSAEPSDRKSAHLPEGVAAVTSSLTSPPDNITLTGESQLAARRRALNTVIWGTNGLPSTQAVPKAEGGCVVSPEVGNTTSPPTTGLPCCQIPGLTNVSKREELHIATDNSQEEQLACHYVASSPNGRLVVFSPGHSCSVAYGPDWTTDDGVDALGDRRAVQTLLGDGYSVLVTFMPRYRPDDCRGLLVPGSPHQDMFTNLHPAQGSVWKYFLQGVSDSLNYLVANAASRSFPMYSEFDMLGLSGGGWTTTVYSAIDTRIKKSVQVAGSEPLDFWSIDFLEEQTTAALYNVAAYRDLYTLGASGTGRRQVQVLNRRDSCCFFPNWGLHSGADWEPSLRTYEANIRNNMINIGDSGFFRLEIDESATQHQISRKTLGDVVLSEFEGGRQHVGAANASDAFVRGGNGHMWHFGSAGWEDTSLNMVGVPAVLSNASHTIDVFYRDQGNGLRQAWKAGSAWTSQSLGGTLAGDPAAVSWGPGRFDIVAFQQDDALYHWSSAQAGADLPVPSLRGVGTPTIVSAGINSLDAVFRDMSGGVSRLLWDGVTSNWGSEALGGQIIGFPSIAVTFDSGSVPVRRVYALGHDNMLYENAKHGSNAWSTWISISANAGTKLAGSPRAMVRNSDSVVIVHVRTATNQLAIFSRPGPFWNASFPGGTIFQGAPTPTPSGATWVDGADLNDLQLFSGGSWSSKGRVLE